MTASPVVRPRSTAAIVATRADPGDAGAGVAPPAPGGRSWFWLWWIPLGLLVAGAWALLLAGNSPAR